MNKNAVENTASTSSSDAQASKKVTKVITAPKVKAFVPIDDETDPRAVMLLSGHATEVRLVDKCWADFID